MKDAPIPAVLDLWSLGHSASDIARRLGVTSGRYVAQIVEHARDIGDPRAVLHVGKNGRPIGRGDRGMRVLVHSPDVEVVQSIPASMCRRGHLRTPENVDRFSNCRVCKRIRDRRPRARR